MPWFTGWTSPWLAVGWHHDGSPWRLITGSGSTSACFWDLNQPFYGPDTLFFGPCGPGGGPYGRREHGRFRRSDGRSPGVVKGLTGSNTMPRDLW